MKTAKQPKRVRQALAARLLPHASADESTKPGYLAERMAQWRELAAAAKQPPHLLPVKRKSA